MYRSVCCCVHRYVQLFLPRNAKKCQLSAGGTKTWQSHSTFFTPFVSVFSVSKIQFSAKSVSCGLISFSFRISKKWRLKTKDFALTLIAIKRKRISRMKISRREKSNCSSVPTVKLPSSAEKHARNRLGKKDTKNGVLASIIPRNFIIYTKIRNTEYQKIVRASQLL